eukprot:Skav213750  [mRNA]  locus=scaffold258:89574:93023:+ [translate_table: standard]
MVTKQPDTPGARLVSAIMHWGKQMIHCISIYGYPSTTPNAKQNTDLLLREAAELVHVIGLPTIIAGDFNMPLEQLATHSYFAHRGFASTKDLFPKIMHHQMPMTCRNSTCNDQVLFDPFFVDRITAMQVDRLTPFHDHSPVIVDLIIDAAPPNIVAWDLPQSWVPWNHDPALANQLYVKQCVHYNLQDPEHIRSHHDMTSALQAWAQTVEHSIAAAVVQLHKTDPQTYPAAQLPRNARGRMRKIKLKQKPQAVNIPQACAGQYNPKLDTANHTILLQTRQLRRIQSYYYLAQKHTEIIQDPHIRLQLRQEWQAIATAKGFQGFPRWCTTVPELGFFPYMHPPLEYVHDLIQVLRHFVDMQSYQYANQKRARAKANLDYDKTRGSLASTMQHVRGNVTPPVQSLELPRRFDARVTLQDHGLIELYVHQPQGFRLDRPAWYGTHLLHPQALDRHSLTLMLDDAEAEIEATGTLIQMDHTADPDQIAEAMQQFWDTFWNRDTEPEQSDAHRWADFQQLLDQVTSLPDVTVNVQDIEPWLRSAIKLKSKTARGCDGIYADEIKQLGPDMVQTIATIFHLFHETSSFPDHLNHALTVPLRKSLDKFSPADVRPITVLPLLYRWWASTTASQILFAWSRSMPTNVIGFLPGRNPQHHLLHMQHMFEQSLSHRERTAIHQGLTLDLVKCFNTLPRKPGALAMRRCGIPPSFIAFWQKPVTRQTRWWRIRQTFWKGRTSTTGAAEGDTWSILVCIALSYVWIWHLLQLESSPATYADNWTWRTSTTARNKNAIRFTIRYTASIRVTIDWSKTWAWTTQRTRRKAWKTTMRSTCPELTELKVLSTAQELGYTLHYHKVHSRATMRKRRKIAIQHLHRARQLKLDILPLTKIATYALQRALWGTHTHVVGQQWLTDLRSTIAKTLIPGKSGSNPFLACALASKHLDDPTVHLIWDNLRTIRQFLACQPGSTREAFFNLAATHSTRHSDVWGPAGAFAYNLLRIGWTCTRTGVLLTDTPASFHLLTGDLKEIKTAIEQSWIRMVFQCKLTRPEWNQLPYPDCQGTKRILHQLSPSEHKTVLAAITGSSMTAHQLGKFLDRDDLCALCDQFDCREHRVLHCVATERVRQNHVSIVEWLRTMHPMHVHMPVLYEPAHVDFGK